MSAASERRGAGRVAVSPGSGVCNLQLDGGAALEVQAIDVSERGILVEVPLRFVPQFPALTARLGLDAHIGDGADGRPLSVSCQAEVVWMGGDAKGGERHYRSGLRFIDLSPQTLHELRRWLG